MNLLELQGQIQVFARPNSSNQSPLVTQNTATWLNELVLKPLYKLRRWWFLNQKQTVSLLAGVSTYTLQNQQTALYIVSGTSAGQPLLLPPIAQAEAFYSSTGPPEAVSLVVPLVTGGMPIGVSQIQVFPTPDTAGPYTLNLDYTAPFASLQRPSDHNFLTDQFPMLVIAGGVAAAKLAFEEDQAFQQWWSIYVNQVRTLAAYDHEVRRGGTMPEPIEPFIPFISQLVAPAAVAAGAPGG